MGMLAHFSAKLLLISFVCIVLFVIFYIYLIPNKTVLLGLKIKFKAQQNGSVGLEKKFKTKKNGSVGLNIKFKTEQNGSFGLEN